MEERKSARLLSSIDNKYLTFPAAKRCQRNFSGTYELERDGDKVFLPAQKSAPGLLRSLGGVAYRFIIEDERYQLLVPEIYIPDDIEGFEVDKLPVSKTGRIVLPDLCNFYGGLDVRLSLVGGGPFLKLVEAAQEEAVRMDDQEYQDSLVDHYSGCPVGTGSANDIVISNADAA